MEMKVIELCQRRRRACEGWIAITFKTQVRPGSVFYWDFLLTWAVVRGRVGVAGGGRRLAAGQDCGRWQMSRCPGLRWAIRESWQAEMMAT